MNFKIDLLVLVVTVVFLSSFSFSTQPTKMSLQGNVEGLIDGNLGVKVSDTNSCSSGVIFDRNFTNAIQNGSFSLLLGDSTDLNLNYNTDYYLCLSVNGQAVGGAQKFVGGHGQVHAKDTNSSEFRELFSNNISTNRVQSVGNSQLALATNDVNRLIVGSDGNTGVGVLVPKFRLDVNGNLDVWRAVTDSMFTPPYYIINKGMAHLVLENSASSYQQTVIANSFNGTILSGIRADYAGYLNYLANNGHVFYGSLGVDTPLFALYDTSAIVHTDLSVYQDLVVSGKITASGGFDPPYVLYDRQSIGQVAQRVANEVPPEKLNGLVVWYDGVSLMAYKPDSGKYYEISMVEKGEYPLPESKSTFETKYYFDVEDGEVKQISKRVTTPHTVPFGMRVDPDNGEIVDVVNILVENESSESGQ